MQALPRPSVRPDEARARRVGVETGLDDGKMIQVKGLRGGEQVVLASSGTLEDGSAVAATRAGS